MMVIDKWSTDLFLQFLRLLFLLLPFSSIGVKQPRAAYRSTALGAGDTLAFPEQIAAVLGTNEALILQKFHEWIEYNQWAQKQDHFIDGRWWTYNSYEKWQEKHFRWLSVSTVKRICKKLEKAGVLITGRYAKSASDQTKWYSIDYQKLSTMLSDGVTKRVSSADQKSPVTRSKESHDSNKESSNDSSNPQTAKHQHHQSARAKAATSVDGDDVSIHDSGEDIIVQKMHEAPQPLRENAKHEADAPTALSPSSAAPLPRYVGQLVTEKNLNPAVALRWIESVNADECERAAEAALGARWANDPAALWCSFMQKRDYQHVPTVQQTADDYSTNYSHVDETPAVDEYETEVDPAPYIDPERVKQWQSAFVQLELQLDKASFDTWLRDAHLVAFEDEAFVIGVRNDAARQMLAYRLNKKIDRILEDVVGASVAIRYEVYIPRKRHEDQAMPLFKLLAREQR